MDFAAARLRHLFRRPTRSSSRGEPDPASAGAEIGGLGLGGEEADESAVLASTPPTEAAAAGTGPGRRDLYYTSSDGLRLHAVEYGDPGSPWLPVVCIPGLSRSARDFHDLAVHLSTDRLRPRRVLCFDLRGRGGSEWDTEVSRYTPLVEMQDVLDGMTAFDVGKAMVVGTSRGGIIAMLMAVARPSVMGGVVLNDIGPAIEPRGLARIKTYVGRTPAPDDWDDAVRILRRVHGTQFTALGEEEWVAFARMTWREEDGRPVSDYDPALARTLDGVEFDRPMPSLWKEYGALASIPTLSIRGENSDLLSAETVMRMARELPGLERITVEGAGHAPLLIHAAMLERISAFFAAAEGEAPATAARRDLPDFRLDAPEGPVGPA